MQPNLTLLDIEMEGNKKSLFVARPPIKKYLVMIIMGVKKQLGLDTVGLVSSGLGISRQYFLHNLTVTRYFLHDTMVFVKGSKTMSFTDSVSSRF